MVNLYRYDVTVQCRADDTQRQMTLTSTALGSVSAMREYEALFNSEKYRVVRVADAGYAGILDEDGNLHRVDEHGKRCS